MVGLSPARKARPCNSPSITLSRAWLRAISSFVSYFAPNTVTTRAAAGPNAIWHAATDSQRWTRAAPSGSPASHWPPPFFLASYTRMAFEAEPNVHSSADPGHTPKHVMHRHTETST